MPVDDGGCDHLRGQPLPRISLTSTRGDAIDLAEAKGWTVLYIYPQTGVPGIEMPAGWDSIPGARGCTPQSCAYRDEYEAFRGLGVSVLGLSTQTTEAQREFAEREHIPFPLLSDPHRQVGEELRLPTFVAGGNTLYKRLTLVASGGMIEVVRYPVFPPNTDAGETLRWLRSNT